MPEFECWDEDVDVGGEGLKVEAESSREAAKQFIREGEFYPSAGYEGVLVADQDGVVTLHQFDVRVSVSIVATNSEVLGPRASLVGQGRKGTDGRLRMLGERG